MTLFTTTKWSGWEENRHILEVTRSLLIDGNVPSHLWGEAVRSAVYLINWTPSSVLNFRRPLDVLSGHCILPSRVYLPPHVLGCVIFVHLHLRQRTKLEEWAIKCVFVGYRSTSNTYFLFLFLSFWFVTWFCYSSLHQVMVFFLTATCSGSYPYNETEEQNFKK